MISSLREMKIFWDMKIYGYFFFGGGGVHHEIGLYLGLISMHFRVFSLRQGFFGGLLKFQIFLMSLKFLIFHGGEW